MNVGELEEKLKEIDDKEMEVRVWNYEQNDSEPVETVGEAYGDLVIR